MREKVGDLRRDLQRRALPPADNPYADFCLILFAPAGNRKPTGSSLKE